MPKQCNHRKLRRRPGWLLHDSEGSQILEFAVALPLLAVFIVGIYDFSGAFNLRQKLSNVAREGALLGASQLTSDLDGSPTPVSVSAIRDEIDAYLQAAQINDCGLGNPVLSGSAVMTWTATGNCTASSNFTATIERAYATLGPTGVKVLCTRVTLSYPYQWRFNSIIQTLVPGAAFGNVQIASVSTFPNLN